MRIQKSYKLYEVILIMLASILLGWVLSYLVPARDVFGPLEDDTPPMYNGDPQATLEATLAAAGYSWDMLEVLSINTLDEEGFMNVDPVIGAEIVGLTFNALNLTHESGMVLVATDQFGAASRDCFDGRYCYSSVFSGYVHLGNILVGDEEEISLFDTPEVRYNAALNRLSKYMGGILFDPPVWHFENAPDDVFESYEREDGALVMDLRGFTDESDAIEEFMAHFGFTYEGRGTSFHLLGDYEGTTGEFVARGFEGDFTNLRVDSPEGLVYFRGSASGTENNTSGCWNTGELYMGSIYCAQAEVNGYAAVTMGEDWPENFESWWIFEDRWDAIPYTGEPYESPLRFYGEEINA